MRGSPRLPAFLKRGLRSTADQAARVSGILARRERSRARGLTVLTYHRVLPESRCARYPFPSLVMPLGAFLEQVRWLAMHGEVVTLSHALELNGAFTRRPLYALTFDDGYDDSGDVVARALEDAGLRGTFFVATGFVGSGEMLWFDRAALLFEEVGESVAREIVEQVGGERLPSEREASRADGATWTRRLKGFGAEERRTILDALETAAGGPPPIEGFRPLSAARLAEMHRRGHEIGSHTVTHAMLPGLDDDALRGELERSRDAIRGWTGGEVRGFCYPNGDHDERTVAAVERAGHTYACTTRDGFHPPRGDPFRIRRVDVAPHRVVDGSSRLDVTAFRRELCGLYRRRERAPVA